MVKITNYMLCVFCHNLKKIRKRKESLFKVTQLARKWGTETRGQVV